MMDFIVLIALFGGIAVANLAVHEIGHYLVATYYHLMPKFGYGDGMFMVRLPFERIPKYMWRNTLVAGPLVSVIFLLLVMLVLPVFPIVVWLALIAFAALGQAQQDIADLIYLYRKHN